jgi:hypothetical protein
VHRGRAQQLEGAVELRLRRQAAQELQGLRQRGGDDEIRGVEEAVVAVDLAGAEPFGALAEAELEAGSSGSSVWMKATPWSTG